MYGSRGQLSDLLVRNRLLDIPVTDVGRYSNPALSLCGSMGELSDLQCLHGRNRLLDRAVNDAGR